MPVENDKAPIHTERIEEKFIIQRRLLESFLKLFKAYMRPYHPPGGDQGNVITNRSVYFDSPQLDDLKDHLNGKKKRKKIRIRSYLSDGKKTKNQFLEMKSKEDNKCIKTRIKIGPDHVKSLMKESNVKVDEELIILNEDFMSKTDLILKMGELNYIMKEGYYKPIVKIDYNRSAYQNGENFRVTLDEDLRIEALPNFDISQLDGYRKDLKKLEYKFINFEDIIIEVKHRGKLPKWLQSKFSKHFLEPESFSKFCWAIARLVHRDSNK
jgi:hypothetical protein